MTRHTILRPIAFALLLALAACGKPSAVGQSAADSPAGTAPAPADLPAAAPSLATPSALPAPAASATADYAPPVLTPEAAKGEKGARAVLLSWAKALENRQFRAAYALFGPHGPANGQSAADFAAGFARYKTISVALGTGDVEGAAGSSFYAVPVTLTGTKADGSPYARKGTLTLRRVNDVPGAAPWQLAWHVETVEWQGP